MWNCSTLMIARTRRPCSDGCRLSSRSSAKKDRHDQRGRACPWASVTAGSAGPASAVASCNGQASSIAVVSGTETKLRKSTSAGSTGAYGSPLYVTRFPGQKNVFHR